MADACAELCPEDNAGQKRMAAVATNRTARVGDIIPDANRRWYDEKLAYAPGQMMGGAAMAGSVFVGLPEEWLAGFTENWKVIFGPVLVVVVLFARGGLIWLWAEVMRRLGRG